MSKKHLMWSLAYRSNIGIQLYQRLITKIHYYAYAGWFGCRFECNEESKQAIDFAAEKLYEDGFRFHMDGAILTIEWRESPYL